MVDCDVRKSDNHIHIAITLEDSRQLLALWHRMNIAVSKVYEGYNEEEHLTLLFPYDGDDAAVAEVVFDALEHYMDYNNIVRGIDDI